MLEAANPQARALFESGPSIVSTSEWHRSCKLAPLEMVIHQTKNVVTLEFLQELGKTRWLFAHFPNGHDEDNHRTWGGTPIFQTQQKVFSENECFSNIHHQDDPVRRNELVPSTT
jgi:hypothetical protein